MRELVGDPDRARRPAGGTIRSRAVTSGGGVGGDGTINSNYTFYTLTDNGLALQATLTGTRYWVDDDLNRPGL